jgi:hypothetical protein
MNALRELFGLFVDDGSLAIGILSVIAIAGLALPVLGLSPSQNALVFFAACLALMFENVLRAGRR